MVRGSSPPYSETSMAEASRMFSALVWYSPQGFTSRSISAMGAAAIAAGVE